MSLWGIVLSDSYKKIQNVSRKFEVKYLYIKITQDRVGCGEESERKRKRVRERELESEREREREREREIISDRKSSGKEKNHILSTFRWFMSKRRQYHTH